MTDAMTNDDLQLFIQSHSHSSLMCLLLISKSGRVIGASTMGLKYIGAARQQSDVCIKFDNAGVCIELEQRHCVV